MSYHLNRQAFNLLLFLGITAGCREPALDNVEPVPVASTVPAKQVAAQSTPVQPALLHTFRWKPGERALFDLTLSGTLEGPDRAIMQRVGLVSKVVVLLVEQRHNEDLVLVMLQEPEIDIEAEPKPTKENLQGLGIELSQPIWGRYWGGKLTKLYLPTKPSAYAAGLWRSILTAMQLSVPLDRNEAFETTEFDNNGEYEVSYSKVGEETWTKKKLSYLKGLHASDMENPIGSVPAPRLVSSEGEISTAGGLPKKITQMDIIEVPLAGNSGLKGESRLEMSLKESTPVLPEAQLKPSAKLLVLSADEPYVQELPPDAMDQERMKGLTFDQVLRALVARSRDPRKKALWAKKNEQEAKSKDKRAAEEWTEDWARYFAALPAFFRQKPETLAIAEKEIRKDNPAKASLLGGLSSSGNPGAQEILVKLMEDTKLEQSLRDDAIRNLVQCRMPTKKTAERVWQLASDTALKRIAVYGIGIIARKMRKAGEIEQADKIMNNLLARLSEVKDPNESRDILRGISNSGDPAALSAIKPLLTSDIPTVRGGAVEAVRLMETPEADEIIAEKISYKKEKEAGVRVSAIRAASTRAHEDPVLEALLAAATDEPDMKVKKEARKLLFSWSNEIPELRATLEKIADSEEQSETNKK